MWDKNTLTFMVNNPPEMISESTDISKIEEIQEELSKYLELYVSDFQSFSGYFKKKQEKYQERPDNLSIEDHKKLSEKLNDAIEKTASIYALISDPYFERQKEFFINLDDIVKLISEIGEEEEIEINGIKRDIELYRDIAIAHRNITIIYHYRLDASHSDKKSYDTAIKEFNLIMKNYGGINNLLSNRYETRKIK